MRKVRVRRQLHAYPHFGLWTCHAASVCGFGVAYRFEVFGQAGDVVCGWGFAGDVGTGEVDFHGEAEVFVHLGGVGNEGVGHGDFVGGAGYGEDEGFLGGGDGGAEVALADDFVDVPKVFG